MPDPIRVAVLGNSFAARSQLPALRWAGNNEVIGIAGRDLQKARRTAAEYDIPTATTDYRDLMAARPDLVLVSTPVNLHRDMTLAAFDAGAAVLCEKPFALDATEGAAMVAAARGRPAWVDHQLRWSPHVRAIRQMVADGLIGTPWHVRFEMLLPTTRFGTRPWSWWFDADRGGGILGAIGSHMLDLLRWLFGEIETVHCELETFVPQRPDAEGTLRPVTADEYAHLSLGFQSGLRGEVTTSIAIHADHAFFLQVSGSAGTLRLVDGEQLFHAAPGAALEPLDVEPGLPTAAEVGMRDPGLFGRCLPLYLRDVIGAVTRGEADLEDAATFEDGLAIQRVLDAARESAAEG